MTVIMQVARPLSRIEMVAKTHDALRSVYDPNLRLCSDPSKYSTFSQEDLNNRFPTVAGFTWKENSNPVVYSRNLQDYWTGILNGKGSKKNIQEVESLLRGCSEIKLRPDCGLAFITCLSPLEELGSFPQGSQENRVSQQIAQYLLNNSPEIEKIAVTSKYENKLVVQEVKAGFD